MKSALLGLIPTIPAFGQCVMCNRTAAAQNLARAGVLNTGIVILLIPPFLILGGLTWLALRKSKES